MDKVSERVIGQFEKYISYTLLAVGLLFATYQMVELVVLVLGVLFKSIANGEFYEKYSTHVFSGVKDSEFKRIASPLGISAAVPLIVLRVYTDQGKMRLHVS
jgi:hypothetical protein